MRYSGQEVSGEWELGFGVVDVDVDVDALVSSRAGPSAFRHRLCDLRRTSVYVSPATVLVSNHDSPARRLRPGAAAVLINFDFASVVRIWARLWLSLHGMR